MDSLDTRDILAFHQRMGRVNHQPINVTSFTNKRLTVNFRVPVDQLGQLLPSPIEPDEIRDTGLGMISMCACDFWVTKLGPLPIPRIRNNEMLLRLSVRIPKGNKIHRAYYTLRSDASSRFLGFCGSRFSHFRKATSRFERVDDGRTYHLNCQAKEPLCSGNLLAQMTSLSKEKPQATVFTDINEATDFIFQLDGSCGYSYEKNKLSFQRIEYPKWDISFCHNVEFTFPILDYLFEKYELDATFDCTLFMQNVPQVWRASWLYRLRR